MAMECNQEGGPNNNQWHLQKSEIMVLFNDHSLSATILYFIRNKQPLHYLKAGTNHHLYDEVSNQCYVSKQFVKYCIIPPHATMWKIVLIFCLNNSFCCLFCVWRKGKKKHTHTHTLQNKK